jgi:hypothetical protein
MSENYKRLDAVQKEIKDLIKKETKLKKKLDREQLTDEELEGVDKLLKVLQGQEKFWREEVSKENKPVAKPSQSFSKMTILDCKRPEGLGLNLKYVEPEIKMQYPSIFLPEDAFTPQPSSWLCETLEMIRSVWAFNTEMGCRTIIDTIITEVLFHSDTQLTVFCETKNDWAGEGFEYTGEVDYMIGKTESWDTAANGDTFLLVIEAKLEWPKSAIPQLLAQAGCLLKRRLKSGKNTPVFAVLTNSENFQFFIIDVDSVVYCSGDYLRLRAGPDMKWNSSNSLVEILRWMYWFVNCMKSVSPRVSLVKLTDESVAHGLAQIRECLGPRNEKFE